MICQLELARAALMQPLRSSRVSERIRITLVFGACSSWQNQNESKGQNERTGF